MSRHFQRLGLFTYFALTIFALAQKPDQNRLGQYITSVVATSDGSVLVVGLLSDSLANNVVIALATSSGQTMWQNSSEHIPTALAMTADSRSVAEGFGQVHNGDPGVIIVDTATGKRRGGLEPDEALGFDPGIGYNTWGDGIVGLAFSPDQSVLYGVSNDTLFSWSIAAKRYLWVKDVPGEFVTPRDLHDILPYGHAESLALSPDGKQLAAARTILHVTSAGPNRPMHFIKRGIKLAMLSPGRPAFSSDSRILAAGDANPLNTHGDVSYALEYWVGSNPKGTRIEGCGGGIAWTDDPNLFGCQSTDGAHLRNINDPTKNIGAAGPPSDLPILKVGNSLWSIAYKNDDWKDATKPLPLTLVELGTGKRVQITIPGRP